MLPAVESFEDGIQGPRDDASLLVVPTWGFGGVGFRGVQGLGFRGLGFRVLSKVLEGSAADGLVRGWALGTSSVSKRA